MPHILTHLFLIFILHIIICVGLKFITSRDHFIYHLYLLSRMCRYFYSLAYLFSTRHTCMLTRLYMYLIQYTHYHRRLHYTCVIFLPKGFRCFLMSSFLFYSRFTESYSLSNGVCVEVHQTGIGTLLTYHTSSFNTHLYGPSF